MLNSRCLWLVKFRMLLKVQVYDSQSQESIFVVNQRENDRLHHCVNVEFSLEVIPSCPIFTHTLYFLIFF
jgi:hypothetical protein